MIRLFTILSIAVFIATSGVVAQEAADSTDTPPAEPVDSTESIDTTEVPMIPVDTLIYLPDTVLRGYMDVVDSTNTERRLRQNPTIALFKSALVPGWGQLSNGKRLKAGIYFGLQAFFVYLAVDYASDASSWRKLFDAETDIGQRNFYRARMDDRADKRNQYTWLAVILAFVSGFDAFVDAHLSGFPVADDDAEIGLDLSPDTEGGVKAAVKFSF